MDTDLGLDIPLPRSLLKKSLIKEEKKQKNNYLFKNPTNNLLYQTPKRHNQDPNANFLSRSINENRAPRSINENRAQRSINENRTSFNKYDSKLSFRKSNNLSQNYNYQRFYKDRSGFQDYKFKGNFALLDKMKKNVKNNSTFWMVFFYFFICVVDFAIIAFFDFLSERTFFFFSFNKFYWVFLKNFSVYILIQLYWHTHYFQFDRTELFRHLFKFEVNLIISLFFVIVFFYMTLNFVRNNKRNFFLNLDQIEQFRIFNFLLLCRFIYYLFSTKNKNFQNLISKKKNFFKSAKNEILLFILFFGVSFIALALNNFILQIDLDGIYKNINILNLSIFFYQYFFCFLTIKIYIFLTRYFYLTNFSEKFYKQNDIKILLDLLIEIEMNDFDDIENIIIQKNLLEFILKNLKPFSLIYFNIANENNDNFVQNWKMLISIYIFNLRKIEDSFQSRNLHRTKNFDLYEKILNFGTYFFYNDENRTIFLKTYNLLKNFDLKSELLKKLVLQNKFENSLSLKINEIKNLLDLLLKNKTNLQTLFNNNQKNSCIKGSVLNNYIRVYKNSIDLLEIINPIVFGQPADIR